MNTKFNIQPEWLKSDDNDALLARTFARLEIRSGENLLTQLEDINEQKTRPGPYVFIYELAEWIADNWWRLRWEPDSGNNSTDWELSHRMSAIGGGSIWPDIAIKSEGDFILIESRQTSIKKEATIRYLNDLDLLLPARDYEAAIDDLLSLTIDRISSTTKNVSDLKRTWELVLDERNSTEKKHYRKLEALCGFDPGEASREYIAKLNQKIVELGSNAVEEMSAAQKNNAVQQINNVVNAARKSKITIECPQKESIISNRESEWESGNLPWQRAHKAAQIARKIWNIPSGPVTNKTLSELFHLPAETFTFYNGNNMPMAAALKDSNNPSVSKAVLRARMETGRRFEVMRLIGAMLVAEESEKLFPATECKTGYQKFQRAFAQEILLPLEELESEVGPLHETSNRMGNDEIEELAARYKVSPLFVGTMLVNHGYMLRERLQSL